MSKSSSSPGSNIVFVTGTDTGVGKTLLAALLLCHLHRCGHRALALKPFCSGDRADATLLQVLQDRELSIDEINPFYFHQPVAPLVAARKHSRIVKLNDVLARIETIAARCLSSVGNRASKISRLPSLPLRYATLLVEGAGGLFAPLGEGFTAADLIAKLGCRVVVVSRNKLGTINHTLLTVRALQHLGIQEIKIVLMDPKTPDVSAFSNPQILAELAAPVPLLSVPFLGANVARVSVLKKKSKKIQKVLAQILR